MKILAIDPGLTTGVAHYDSRTGKVLRAFDETSPVRVAEFMELLKRKREVGVVVLEDVIGQGPRDRYIVRTLKVLGFLEGYGHLLGLEVVLHPPQTRKCMLDKAAKLSGPGMHYTDALAHALAYASLKGGSARGRRM
jgi:hypothetical protein